jgi:hypothetical protein
MRIAASLLGGDFHGSDHFVADVSPAYRAFCRFSCRTLSECHIASEQTLEFWALAQKLGGGS